MGGGGWHVSDVKSGPLSVATTPIQSWQDLSGPVVTWTICVVPSRSTAVIVQFAAMRETVHRCSPATQSTVAPAQVDVTLENPHGDVSATVSGGEHAPYIGAPHASTAIAPALANTAARLARDTHGSGA